MGNSERKIIKKIFDEAVDCLDKLKKTGEPLTDETESRLNRLFSLLCERKGLSEHSHWAVKWTVEKRNKITDKTPYEILSGNFSPDEVATAVGNVILNGGATEMLKIICGISGSIPYSNANAKIYVGSDSTPERANQTGVLASGGQKEYAAMDSGYPSVPSSGRTAVFRATFGESKANFPWNEMSLVNGVSGSSTAMNRKQASMGTKNGGVWSIQLEVSIVDAP